VGRNPVLVRSGRRAEGTERDASGVAGAGVAGAAEGQRARDIGRAGLADRLKEERTGLAAAGRDRRRSVASGTTTIHAADLCSLGDEIGTLEPGKLADVFAVEGDPLADLSVLQRVPFVMKAGVVQKGRGIDATAD